MIRAVNTAQDAMDTYGKFRNQIIDVLKIANDIGELELLRMIDDRKAIMFTDDKSIAIVQIEIVDETNEIMCLVRIACGEMASVLDGIDFVAEWSKNHGAIGMILVGRKGWKRVLKERGFADFNINNNKINNNNKKAGLYLLGKYYGIIPKNNYTDNYD